MNTLTLTTAPADHRRTPRKTPPFVAGLLARLRGGWAWAWTALLAGLLTGTAPARADQSPPGCTGSGLGINLFTSSPDVHIGDTIKYSITVFNGIAGTGRVVCDATGIQAFIVTPDGASHPITLNRTTLTSSQLDFYADVVSYVVRAQDILPDGTVRATASDTGVIHQNDTNSQGGGDQGVNTEVSLPCIGISVQCTGAIGQAGTINFTGAVTNCGNNTLVGVTVTNRNDNGRFTVTFPTNLPAGAVALFSGSFVPLNPCTPDTVTLVALGTDQFTSFPRTVTAQAATTCSTVLTPAIKVTQACPVGPIHPGQLLTYTGTVTNTGDVTLTNVIVLGDHPANTVVFTVATLLPGAGSSFTGSYVAPVDCATASGVVASGTSVCGVPVSDHASITCAILTTPLISVTTQCSTNAAIPGGLQAYTGTVKNTGDIPLKNVVVLSDRPAANTAVFTVASLAPGASASFSGSYTVPLLNACALTTTVVASGHDFCTDAAVTATSAVTCGVTTAPQIAVTLACPAVIATVGGPVTYTGTVSNPGNVTLNNVTVVDAQSTPPTVFTVATLAPGASANFTASFTAPVDACSVSTSVTASGSDACSAKLVTATQAATCPLLTTPGLAVTQNCPATPAVPGGLLTYTGTVRNSGNITLTNVVVLNSLSGATPVFTAATLAPGAVGSFSGSYLAPTNCSSTSTSTATAASSCGVAVSANASSTCTVLTTPQILVTATCPTNAILPGASLSYGGTVRNTGNITLTNVVVTSDRPAANTALFTVATLAPGASTNFTGTYVVPLDSCSLTTTLVATGRDICTLNAVTNAATTTCTIITAPQIAVTLACPVLTANAGGLITYTGTVSNPGNVTLNNVTVTDSQSTPPLVLLLASLAPGASTNFTASFVTVADTCSVSTTVNVSGSDNCTAKLVTASQSATCPLITLPGLAVTQNCPAGPTGSDGLFTYTGTVRNTGNVTLTNVVVLDDRGAPKAITTFWVDDATPVGAQLFSDGGDSWNWVTNNPAPFSGTLAHKSNVQAGEHQHFFLSTNSAFTINPGDILVTYVYLDPANPPSEVMLQWNDGTWQHRAFWGDDKVDVGEIGTASRLRMGPLPVTGQWVRLEVPAHWVNLENRPLVGMAFTLFDGQATWDASGKTSAAVTGLTQVFTVATLAPGASAGFTGSYLLPASGVCSVTTTLSASAADRCTGVNVTATSVQTCPIQTTPAIVVTHDCPSAPVLPGTLLSYSGSVSNAGNITLTNIIVTADRPGTNTVIFTAATLAPGDSLSFTGSFRVPLNCCVVSSTLGASGQGCDGVTVNDTDTRTCTVLTLPQLVVTKICTSPGLLRAGDLLTYAGTVSNAGNIVLINVRVENDQTPRNPPVAGPLTLAPGESYDYVASYIVPADFCGTDTVTASGLDVCTFLTVTDSVTTTCPVVTPPPRIAVTKDCPLVPTPRGGLYTYTGTVRNPGTVTLVDVYVVNDLPTNNTPILGPITLAPGQIVAFTNSFIAPRCCCLVVETLIARGQDRCSGISVTAKTTTVCPLLSTPVLVISRTSTAGTVPVGGLYTFGGSVKNTGDVVLTNVVVFSSQPNAGTRVLGPIELAPGESAAFTGSYPVRAGIDPATDTVTGSGTDTCQGRTVSASANNLGATGLVVPKITSITVAGDVVTVVWDAAAGSTYSLQSKASLTDAWSTVPGDVTASGTTGTKHEAVQTNSIRFYRIIYAGQ